MTGSALAVEAIRLEGLPEVYPEATEGDLFLWVHQRRRDLWPEGGGLSFEEAARSAREAEAVGGGGPVPWFAGPWARRDGPEAGSGSQHRVGQQVHLVGVGHRGVKD